MSESLNSIITGILNQATQEILQAVQGSSDGQQWIRTLNEDGNPDLPSDERRVLVFQCGDRPASAPRPDDAAWGEAFGYFDHDKHRWRVNGLLSRHVTHWRETPSPPTSAQ